MIHCCVSWFSCNKLNLIDTGLQTNGIYAVIKQCYAQAGGGLRHTTAITELMTKQDTQAVPDGRHLRSERSRQAIIDAMLGLVEEGILVPTAQQVSERAGVGIRSVFRHFSDMESLFATADNRIREQYQGLFAGGDREGSLEERLLHAVEQRGLAYEAVGNHLLTTRGQLWRYPVLREQYARLQRQLRKDLDDWVPELKELATDEREVVDALASFEFWNRLREQQGLNRKTSVRLTTQLLYRIISRS
jgi:AcrR family transcriptional regulator